MTKRYSGEFSPSSDQDTISRTRAPATRVDPAGIRTNLLFVPGIVLVLMALNDGALGLTLGLTGAGVLTLAAWLLREGLRAEAAFNARKVARRPAFPRKISASLLTGVGVAIAAFKTGFVASDPGLIAPVLFGIMATVLHALAFGLDPIKDKGMEGIDTFQQNRAARAVTGAETYLAAMRDAALRAGDRQIETRVDRFQTTARALFRTVQDDPRDLTQARKYLTVYLVGARDATIKFADIQSRSRDAQARADYLALLDDLEQNFAARTEKMLLDDHADLSIEIDVLRERLQRETVRADRRT